MIKYSSSWMTSLYLVRGLTTLGSAEKLYGSLGVLWANMDKVSMVIRPKMQIRNYFTTAVMILVRVKVKLILVSNL